MQKVVQRTVAAQRQAQRRSKKQAGKLTNAKEWTNRANLFHRNRIQSNYFLHEKLRRRDEYEKGPLLAPRYDTGVNAETYGTIDHALAQPHKLPYSKLRNVISPFAKGDRVIVTKGKDRGKIGQILQLELHAAAARVQGVSMADFFVPESMRIEDSDPTPIIQQPMAVPWDNLKLVFPLRDQSTGHFEDTVVDKVEIKNASWHPKTMQYTPGQRYLPGTKIALPWPATEEPDKNDGHDDDTLRIDVDEVTHRPYLLQPPMPPSVIDELRNKYSLFRTRHEPEYVAAQEAKDRAAKRNEELARIVSTPLAELKERKRQQLMDQPLTLSDEQLAKIGQVMATEKLNATARVAQRQQ